MAGSSECRYAQSAPHVRIHAREDRWVRSARRKLANRATINPWASRGRIINGFSELVG
jgi:hypothetical protein